MTGASGELDTRWGVLYASTNDGETVRFSTVDPDGGRARSRLTLNGVEYSFQISLRRGELPRGGPDSFWRLDETWHVSADEALHSLRRPDGGEFTANAWMRVRDVLLPSLAGWLHGGAGEALLQDGHMQHRTEQARLVDDASLALLGARARVELLQHQLEGGEPISASEERFLQDLRDQVQRCIQTVMSADSPPVASPRPRPPEVPGL